MDPAFEVDVAAPRKSVPLPVTLFGCLLMGVQLGFCFEKTNVYKPRGIRGQFVFAQWTMIKMFMGAVAGASLSFSVLSKFAPKRFATVRAEYHAGCPRSYLHGGVGAAMLGVGMSLSGACPGMVISQVGVNCPDALYTLLGGLVGATMFGVVAPKLPNLNFATPPKENTFYLDQKIGWSYTLCSLGFGLFSLAFCAVLEYLVDYVEDAGQINGYYPDAITAASVFALPIWSPTVGGFFLGCIQMPCAFIMRDSIGGSTWYETAGAQALRPIYTNEELTVKVKGGLGSHWQMVYTVGAALGAFLSAFLSGTFPSAATGVGAPAGFLGGVLMLFGSRYGCGCTSGHGISGMPLLSPVSVIACCTMFGGGIVAALVLRAVGLQPMDTYDR